MLQDEQGLLSLLFY